MANRELLKEAIADAKAVKETAIANAKAALEESFAPMLREKLAAKLAEMDKMEEEEVKEAEEMKEEEIEETYNTTEEGMDKMEEEKVDEAEEVDEEMDLEELLKELDELEEEEKVDEAETTDEALYEEEKAEEAEEMEMDSEEEEIDIENMDEDDLKKFIEDVIADMVEAGELEGDAEKIGGEEEETEEEETEEEETEEEPMMENAELVTEVTLSPEEEAMLKAFLEKPAGSKPSSEEAKLLQKLDENNQLNEIFGITMATIGAVKLLGIIFGLIGGATALKYRKLAQKEKAKLAIIMPYLEKKMAGKDREEVLKNGLLRIENSKFDDLGLSDEHQKELSGLKEGSVTTATQNNESLETELKEELNEAYNTIRTIKEELAEVNLFNAKLLYTNKIFKSKNLTEGQKVKVLAAFDKAASVKEAKLVFETLNEGFTTKKTSVNESLIRGGASKPAGSAAKKPIMESNDQVLRMQKLAGIIK